MYLSSVLVQCLCVFPQASDSRAFGLLVPGIVSPMLGSVNNRHRERMKQKEKREEKVREEKGMDEKGMILLGFTTLFNILGHGCAGVAQCVTAR